MPVNWDAMPVWPAKRAAQYLGLRRGRLLSIVKGTLDMPEGAPPLVGETDGNRHYYLDAASVKTFKTWLEKNPDSLKFGGKRLPAGVFRYRIYLTPEQESTIRELIPEIQLVRATKRKKVEAEPETA